MPDLLVRHRVADDVAWKPPSDEHGAVRRANGCRGGRLCRNEEVTRPLG